jgi:hypothetical protein
MMGRTVPLTSRRCTSTAKDSANSLPPTVQRAVRWRAGWVAQPPERTVGYQNQTERLERVVAARDVGLDAIDDQPKKLMVLCQRSACLYVARRRARRASLSRTLVTM